MAGTLTTFGLLIFLRHRITSGRPERLHAIARDRFQSEPSWWTRLFLRSSSIATRAAMPYGILVLAIRVNPRFVTIRKILDALPLALVIIAIGANVYWLALVAKLRDLTTINNQQSAIANPQSPITNHNSLRPSIALCMVTSSAYSRSLPTGTPIAMRVTRTPSGLSSLAR